jgi:hypothetical protein
MNPLTPWADPNGEESEFRRSLERLWGFPPGAFNPGSIFLRDVERINRSLGQGFVLLQQAIAPEQLIDRIEAALEAPVRAIENIPREHLTNIQPHTDGYYPWRR